MISVKYPVFVNEECQHLSGIASFGNLFKRKIEFDRVCDNDRKIQFRPKKKND